MLAGRLDGAALTIQDVWEAVGAFERGLMVGHVAPEAARGGPLAAVADGDPITIDVDAGRLDAAISDDGMARRLAAWAPPPPRFAAGVFARYAATVGSASDGAVLTPPSTAAGG